VTATSGRVLERLARRGGAVELLWLPALLFGAGARLRGSLYDRGLLPIRQLDTPVVSIGNLTAGGTGKTPMVAFVAAALEELGLRPGILSRGYGKGDAAENEEAQLLARLLPSVPHVQDPDRVAGGTRLQDLGVDVIVLDDGYQHRRLARDLDVVLVDATRPWGLPARGGPPVRAFQPRGLLREAPSALRRADLIVITRADAADSEALRGELACFGVPISTAVHAPVGLRTLADEALDLSALQGVDVDLVSGVGNPQAFEATVRGLGADVREHRVFPDHHRFSPGDLDGLGARPVVVTAKDAPKLPATAEVWVLDVALRFLDGEDLLRARLAALPEGLRGRERAALHEGLHG
jgi:tetraacyldisaccharide 4'-kinase